MTDHPPVSARFTFRFVSRGPKADTLTGIAVRALRWCHPPAQVVVVDANDEPTLSAGELAGSTVIHLPPGEDDVARSCGRGSRKHLFHWRHSPDVQAVVSRQTEFSAYVDSDLVLSRPMDLGALTGPLSRGRIAAVVDESTISYLGLLGGAAAALATVLPVAGVGGPLVQSGLVFTGTDDGNLHRRLWDLAVRAARSSVLDALPFDDMCLLTSLLSERGALWERFLPLGQEWNFITARDKEPGAFGVGAHYGGFRAKQIILDKPSAFEPPTDPYDAWGAVGTAGEAALRRGVLRAAGEPRGHRVTTPFALSWRVPDGSSGMRLRVLGGDLGVTAFYRDGVAIRPVADDQWYRLDVGGCDVVTVVGTPGRAGPADVTVEPTFLYDAGATTAGPPPPASTGQGTE
jgi:hypothetical protein